MDLPSCWFGKRAGMSALSQILEMLSCGLISTKISPAERLVLG